VLLLLVVTITITITIATITITIAMITIATIDTSCAAARRHADFLLEAGGGVRSTPPPHVVLLSVLVGRGMALEEHHATEADTDAGRP